MTRSVKLVALIVGLALGWWSWAEHPAGAQPPATKPTGSAGAQRDIEVTVPPPTPRAAAPGLGLETTAPPEQTSIREQEFYPGSVRSQHAPTFVTPFVRTVPVSRSWAVRGGLSVWTTPAVPFDIRQSGGGAAIGFTFVWGVPAPEGTGPAAPPGDSH